MTDVALTDPATFTRDFFDVANESPPPNGEARLGTAWFEQRMLALAARHGLYCQNKQSPRPGEWMKVDHVFVRPNPTYAHFPLIAVEHENGNMSNEGAAGRVPAGTTVGAYIEWALWKALTMRSKLSVLVAYPWAATKDRVLVTLAGILDGFAAEYGHDANALLLLGWWPPVSTPWRAESVYSPYRSHRDSAGRIQLRLLAGSTANPTT